MAPFRRRVLILMWRCAQFMALALMLAASGCGRNESKPLDAIYGNVDIREANLGFRVAGRLASVLKQEGDAIQAGETVARLDQEPFQHEAAEAQARVAAAQAQLKRLQAGPRVEEIAQARAVVNEREVSLANSKGIFERQAELLKNRTISEQERDDAEARYREAEARLNSAREQLKFLEAGYRVEDIAAAKAELERAEAASKSAALRLADTELKAPEAGIVLTRAQEPGAILPVGTTVLTLSLREPVWVRAYVEETHMGQVKPGMRVEVFTDSRPGTPYHGQIGYVASRAEFTPKSVETPALRTSLVYRVRVIVEDPDDQLKQGMPVTVRLQPAK